MRAFLVAQMVKNPLAMRETWVRSLDWEQPLDKGMATHSSMLAWIIPVDQRNLADDSPWGHKESDMTEQLNCHQFNSVAQSCLTLCHPTDCSRPGFPVHHRLLEFTQTHVH